MAWALPYGFLDGLSIEAHTMETRRVTSVGGKFARAVSFSVRMAHAAALRDKRTSIDVRRCHCAGGTRTDGSACLLRSVGSL